MTNEEKNINVSTTLINKAVRYVHESEEEITNENVIGIYINAKKELIPNVEGIYQERNLMRVTIVTNGPFISTLPENKNLFRRFLWKKYDTPDKILLVDFVITSLQDYKDYSMCADIYNGDILRDDYGTLKAIKDDFSKSLSEVDKQVLTKEKVCFYKK